MNNEKSYLVYHYSWIVMFGTGSNCFTGVQIDHGCFRRRFLQWLYQSSFIGNSLDTGNEKDRVIDIQSRKMSELSKSYVQDQPAKEENILTEY